MRASTMRSALPLLLTGFLLAGCGGTPSTADAPPEIVDRPASASAETAGDGKPVEQFLAVTADHVCEVQGQIYETPEDLAAAYDQAPDYPGLDEAVVTRLQQRLETDAGFSDDLNRRVSDACG